MNDDSNQPRTRCTSWLVFSGIATLMFSGLCLAATTVGMMQNFHSISTSQTALEPADLAIGISESLLPAQAVFPCVVVGTILIVTGFIRRQPAPNE